MVEKIIIEPDFLEIIESCGIELLADIQVNTLAKVTQMFRDVGHKNDDSAVSKLALRFLENNGTHWLSNFLEEYIRIFEKNMIAALRKGRECFVCTSSGDAEIDRLVNGVNMPLRLSFSIYEKDGKIIFEIHSDIFHEKINRSRDISTFASLKTLNIKTKENNEKPKDTKIWNEN